MGESHNGQRRPAVDGLTVARLAAEQRIAGQRAARERSKQIAERVLDGRATNPGDIRHLAAQFKEMDLLTRTQRVRIDAGLFFEFLDESALENDENALVVLPDEDGFAGSLFPARWHETGLWVGQRPDGKTLTKHDEVYAVLRIPKELSSIQHLFIDDEREGAGA